MADRGFVIKEKYPDGKNSVKAMLDVINKSEDLANDGRSLWAELLQPIEDAMKYEFSDANPNNWPGLKADTGYVDWKRSKGYPVTIGIMSGALKRASTSEAVVKQTKDALNWGVNPDVRGYKGKPVGDYAEYFNDKTENSPARPLFGFTRKWVKDNIINEAVKLWVKIGWSKG